MYNHALQTSSTALWIKVSNVNNSDLILLNIFFVKDVAYISKKDLTKNRKNRDNGWILSNIKYLLHPS